MSIAPAGASLAPAVRYDHLLFVAGVVFWRVALDVAYVDLLFPLNEYFGFRYAPDPFRIAESYGFTIVGAALLPRDGRLPSTYALHIFFVLGIVPILSYFAMGGEARWMLYSLLLGYAALVAAVRILPPLIVPPLTGMPSLALAVMLGLVALSVASLVVRVGLGGLNLDLSKVYEFREGATAELYSGLWAYLYSWVGGAVCVALMVYCLATRRYAMAAGALMAQVFIFAATSHKVYLFQPVIAAATYWLLVRGAWRTVLIWGLCTLVGGTIALFVVFDLDIVGDLIVRRTLFVPAFLNFRYLEFFSANPKVWLTNSFLSNLGDYPYGELATGMVIGNYVGFPDVNAVTGYLGTAYMNLGVPGILAYSVLVALVLRWLDGCVALGLPAVLVAAASIAPVRAVLTESDLFTALLTHGLGLVLILLSMLVGVRPGDGGAERLRVSSAR